MPESKATSTSKPNRIDSLLTQVEFGLLRSMIPPSRDAEPSLEIPAAANPAVARCVRAYNEAYEAVMQKPDKQIRDARCEGQFAYRQHLPPLVGRRNITDFIACIGHGMLCRAIDHEDGTRILYAAQIATNNRNKQPSRKQKDTRQSAKNVWKATFQHPKNSNKWLLINDLTENSKAARPLGPVSAHLNGQTRL